MVVFVLVACQSNDGGKAIENREAKAMLQGLWVSATDGSVSFLASGDTIFYPDTTSQPARFWIFRDSLYLQGAHTNSYKIKQQSPVVFIVETPTGEDASWQRSNDETLMAEFPAYRPYALNFYYEEEVDTTASAAGVTYQCHVSLVPNSDRVIASSFNDDGIEVDNVYLDQTASLSVVERGKGTILKRQFQKKDFARYIPSDFLSKSILRGLEYNDADDVAVYFDAIIGIPNISTSYVVEVKVARDGAVGMKLK